MSLDQIIGLSGIPLFALFFLNYGFLAYVATYKLKEIQSHFQHSSFVKFHRGDANTPLIFRTGNLLLIWSLLVIRPFCKLDPVTIEEVKHFPKHLRPWVIVPGHINAFCLVWGFGIVVWINMKGYL